MKFLPVVALGALLMGCADSPAEIATNKTRPQFSAFTFVMPANYDGPVCNGDVVALVGESHVVFSVTVDGAGGFYIRTQTNSKTSGLGLPSAHLYEGKQETTDLLYAKRGATSTFVETIKVRARSPLDDFLFHTVMRLVIDDEGTVTPRVEQAFIKCGGETVGP